jgi:methanogenic corrinoid protein MtbC1
MLKQQSTPIAPEAELNQPSLEQMVRSRVIPQLLQLHESDAVLPETDGLIDVLLVGGSGMEQASAAMQRGIGYETIMLSLLAPAARALNALWEQDRCSFATVTLAMWRLRSLMRRLSEDQPDPLTTTPPERIVLISTLPGEQHDFGAAMVSEFFRRDGWLSQHIRPTSIDDLVGEVDAARPALLGLSIGHTEGLGLLRKSIAAIRRTMRRHAPAIMVGGAALSIDPELSARSGADGCSLDARTALSLAARLVDERANRFPSSRIGQISRKDKFVGLPNSPGGVFEPGPADHRAFGRGRG